MIYELMKSRRSVRRFKPEPPSREQIERLINAAITGAAMAIENLLLVAHAMRLGASGMTGPLVASDRIREILEIQTSWDIAAFIPVGFAAEEPPAPGRKPADQVTRWIE